MGQLTVGSNPTPSAAVPDRDTDPVVNMGPDQVRAFLSHGTRTAKVATVTADGRPHVVPVWFVLEGDDLIFTTHETSQKARSLRRDPRVACCIDDERPPYSYVMVTGAVTLSTNLDDLRAGRPGSEGATWAKSEPRNSDAATVCPASSWCVTPTKIISVRDVAS